MGVTAYTGLSQFYFRYLLKQIIKTGALEQEGIAILDFGCGRGELKRMLPDKTILGYDILPHLSEVPDWRGVNFDVLVANEVFYSFSEMELTKLLDELRKHNPSLVLVIGISRQGALNNIGKYLLGRLNAHSATKIKPRMEVEILKRYCQLERSKNVLNLADIFVFKFK
jgi:hypothetical protein